VLIGEAVSRSGVYAPLAFLVAALLMALSAASFAELAGQLPVAAGEQRVSGRHFSLIDWPSPSVFSSSLLPSSQPPFRGS
jgi:hypothetical protein